MSDNEKQAVSDDTVTYKTEAMECPGAIYRCGADYAPAEAKPTKKKKPRY